MSKEQNKSHEFNDKTEILLGLDLYGRWSVSHWDNEFNFLSINKFKNYEDADKFLKIGRLES